MLFAPVGRAARAVQRAPLRRRRYFTPRHRSPRPAEPAEQRRIRTSRRSDVRRSDAGPRPRDGARCCRGRAARSGKRRPGDERPVLGEATVRLPDAAAEHSADRRRAVRKASRCLPVRRPPLRCPRASRGRSARDRSRRLRGARKFAASNRGAAGRPCAEAEVRLRCVRSRGFDHRRRLIDAPCVVT
jgi:hypothetical protein